MIMKLYGNTIQRFELRKVTAPTAGAPPAKYAAAINIWINDLEGFLANNRSTARRLTDDVPNFTNGRPSSSSTRFTAKWELTRSAPKLGDTCLTILYPEQRGRALGRGHTTRRATCRSS